MPNHTAAVVALSALALTASLPAQTTSVVPSVCETLPGNAALALPLRWSYGTMQVFVDQVMLPANFIGQTITGLRLRRPTLPDDVAYPALQRTLTVRGGFQPVLAAQMIGGLSQNRPANTAVLFGPAAVTVAATAAPGATTVVGEDLLHIVFTTPLPVVAGSLFLEFETSDAPLQISSDHWVDGIWLANGVDNGYSAIVGDGSCSTRTEPTLLRWTGTTGPSAGTAAALQVSGLPASAIVLAWLGTDPVTRPAGPGYLGFGGDLQLLDASLAGCHQWAPFDASWFGFADAYGRFGTGFPIPSTAVTGTRLGVQAAWFDTARGGGFPFSFSNGMVLVLNGVGVGAHCATMFFPADGQVSPWPAFRGQMPVLMLEH